MNIQQIREPHRAQPFKPFTLRMADGNEYTVKHPEFLMITKSGRSTVLATSDDAVEIIDALLVASIQVGNGRYENTRNDDADRR